MSKVKLQSIKNDHKKRDGGEVIESTEYVGVSYRVRGTGFKPYQVAVTAAEEKYRRTLPPKERRNPLDFEARSIVFGPAIAEHLLLEWYGFDIEYSPEVAEATLSNPEFVGLMFDILACANRVGEAKIEYTEESVKNSKKPSATT